MIHAMLLITVNRRLYELPRSNHTAANLEHLPATQLHLLHLSSAATQRDLFWAHTGGEHRKKGHGELSPRRADAILPNQHLYGRCRVKLCERHHRHFLVNSEL
jgi:hypothetical protein